MKSFARARLIYVLMNALCILVLLVAMVRTTHAAEEAPIFSCGAGRYELIIFTDYFCQPCQKMEGGLNKTIEEMINRGRVRVTLVDLPLFKLTPLYAKYFLYALNASATCKDALKARQFLFERAFRIGAITAEHLERDFKSEGIAIKPYDTGPSLAKYSEIIRKYRVHSTPTFVFVYSPTDVRKYSGSEPIKKGMAELEKALETL